MNKEEFLKQLEQLLRDIPEAERREAVDYYQNYFEDAGSENEMQIILELGSPQKVADSIKKDLFGENYQAYEKMNQEKQQEAFEKQQKENRTLRNILIAVAVVLTFPIWIGILGGIIGLVVGAIAMLFGLSVAAIAIVGSCLVIGFVLIGIGIVKIITGSLAVGLVVIGIGLFMLVIGILGLLAIVWIVGRIVPWVIRAIVRLCKIPFQKRGAAI